MRKRDSKGRFNSEPIHGMSRSREYSSWASMKSRCYNKNETGYKNWGGRGIKVCKRWQSFEKFYEDMGPRPEGASLDRINNDGDYEPGNCRWATRREQSLNMRISARNKSGVMGLHWHKKGQKWMVTCDGKYLGLFADKDKAISVRVNAEKERIMG